MSRMYEWGWLACPVDGMLSSLTAVGRNSGVVSPSMGQWVDAVSPEDTGSVDALLTAV